MTEERAQAPQPEADFGYERVPLEEKKARVRQVFDSVTPSYDLMNDAMSLGLHRAWKRFTALRTGLRPGDTALDVAAGTGDLSIALAKQVTRTGRVFATDINESMLSAGRDRLIDAGLGAQVQFVLADGESLPFADRSFNCVTIGFGLRNFTDKTSGLRSVLRVLKPGGRLLILEFSRLSIAALEPLYDLYSFQVLPRLGKLFANDGSSYRYLAESIRRHPDQETLLQLMQEQGFERCSYHNLSGGVVALHVGYRL